MPFADVQGQRLYYEDSGGRGPVVMMSHGFLFDHELFAHQVEALKSRFRCITWDERGFGQTESDGQPFTLWDAAEDIMGLLDEVGVAEAALVGMSWGGMMATRAALRHPERVLALVLMDTFEESDSAETQAAWREMRDSLMNDGWNDDMGRAVLEMLYGSDAGSIWLHKWRFRSPLTYRPSYEALLSRDDVGERLRSITCPSIVFHGERSKVKPLSSAYSLADRLGNSVGVVAVPGAGHASNFEAPQFVNERLLAFLTRHVAVVPT